MAGFNFLLTIAMSCTWKTLQISFHQVNNRYAAQFQVLRLAHF